MQWHTSWFKSIREMDEVWKLKEKVKVEKKKKGP